MENLEGTLTKKIQRTPNVFSFQFQPEKSLSFIPGQFLEVILNQQNRDDRTLNKYLSFSCAPEKGIIEITKKISNSQFSQQLAGLREGERVLFSLPMGNCILKPDYQKISFLIGGIGITPVISIIEHIIGQKMNTHVCLLYSNMAEADIAFKRELDSYSGDNENINVFYTLINPPFENKQYLSGVIDQNMIKDKINDYQDQVFFIFGPPRMVSAMKDICLEIGCNPEKVKTENFIGY